MIEILASRKKEFFNLSFLSFLLLAADSEFCPHNHSISSAFALSCSIHLLKAEKVNTKSNKVFRSAAQAFFVGFRPWRSIAIQNTSYWKCLLLLWRGKKSAGCMKKVQILCNSRNESYRQQQIASSFAKRKYFQIRHQNFKLWKNWVICNSRRWR